MTPRRFENDPESKPPSKRSRRLDRDDRVRREPADRGDRRARGRSPEETVWDWETAEDRDLDDLEDLDGDLDEDLDEDLEDDFDDDLDDDAVGWDDDDR